MLCVGLRADCDDAYVVDHQMVWGVEVTHECADVLDDERVDLLERPFQEEGDEVVAGF